MLILVQYTFLIAMLLFGYFSAGVKYLQEPYIWADGDCVSTFWWRHIRGITGITTLKVTFSLGYCLCLLLSILIRPSFVRKEKNKEQNETREELFDSYVIIIYCVLIWPDFTLFSSWFLSYHKLSLRKACV